MGVEGSVKIPRMRALSFWHYQISGWAVYAVAELFLGLVMKGISAQYFLWTMKDCAIGFLLTLPLRYYYGRIRFQEMPILNIVIRILISSLIFAGLWLYLLDVLTYLADGKAVAIYMIQEQWRASVIARVFPIPFGWSALYFGVKYWLAWEVEKERKEKANEMTQRAMLQMLRYQLNPHFLFNALNSVRALIDEDITIARTMITELSEFLRYSLMSRDRSDITLRDEIGAIQLYVSVEKKRYEEKLDISYEIDSHTENFPILSFLIQPLVENAVKYGMKTSPLPLKIKIKSVLLENGLQISVINTGKWIPQSGNGVPGTGTGLANVRARLARAFPTRHKFETFEKNDTVNAVIELYDHAGVIHEEKI
jgi:two-component system, LytTR family, sensor kinase